LDFLFVSLLTLTVTAGSKSSVSKLSSSLV
jgi:hypothetical protein